MHPNISFIKFADVSLPKLIETPTKGYIQFGDDNLYPNQLLQMFNKSSKHNAIVLGKVNYITGKGIVYKDGSNSDFTENPNPQETIDELLKKASTDIEVFGGCYLELHWNALKKIGATYHIPYQKVRSNKDNTQFYVKDWASMKRGIEPEIIGAFDPKNPKGKQILFYKEYRPGLETYTYPGYIGALNSIQTDIEISKYHLSTISNGMFSSKMITFNSGVPTIDEQKTIDGQFKRKFTGSENAGSVVVTFVDDPAKAPTVQDLSSTDLDKHFDILNKTIQQEIFAGHQITSPMLFGIRVEGQLGGRSEMRDSYEIFKSTYCNDKQQNLERVFSEISKWWGVDKPMLINPVEPIQQEFTEQTLLAIAPKAWLLEKAGIDATKYPETANINAAPTPSTIGAPNQQMVNENLKNLTGRQWQNVSRIIRNFESGKIGQEQAKLLLQSSLGLSDEEVNVMLSIDNMQFSSQDNDELLLAEFAAVGEKKNDFCIIKSREVFKFGEEHFADVTTLEANVLNLIKKDKAITEEVISKALKITVEAAKGLIDKLESEGRLTAKAKRVGEDVVIERSLTEPVSSLTDRKPKEFLIRYSYEGPKDDRNRTFCRRLLDMDKFYSRSDIETMSQRLGYSVWDRRGGFWNDGGVIKTHCRHNWKSNLIIRK